MIKPFLFIINFVHWILSCRPYSINYGMKYELVWLFLYVRYYFFIKFYCCCVWSWHVRRDYLVMNLYLTPQCYQFHIEKFPTQISSQLYPQAPKYKTLEKVLWKIWAPGLIFRVYGRRKPRKNSFKAPSFINPSFSGYPVTRRTYAQ